MNDRGREMLIEALRATLIALDRPWAHIDAGDEGEVESARELLALIDSEVK